MSHLKLIKSDYVRVQAEDTPNPRSKKFVFPKEISSETADFAEGSDLQRSPFAALTMRMAWVERVYIGRNFVTVTAREGVPWDNIIDPLINAFEHYVDAGRPVLIAQNISEVIETDSEDVKKIKEFLNEQIRPIVARDGGDVLFYQYEDGILKLIMQGACVGCPHSTRTLKDGIESRIKLVIPGVKEVVSV